AALLQRLVPDPRWQTILAVTPDVAVSSRCWPRGVIRVRQGKGDLGCRMQRIMDMLPPGPVAIIGTDVPRVTAAHIAPAFRRLGRHQAVFGRAMDGGYWLVGMRRRPRVLQAFANVRWSGEHALSDTLACLRNVSVGFLATLPAVDDALAFHAPAGQFGRRGVGVWRGGGRGGGGWCGAKGPRPAARAVTNSRLSFVWGALLRIACSCGARQRSHLSCLAVAVGEETLGIVRIRIIGNGLRG